VATKPALSIREKAIFSSVWIITPIERDKLDRFFLMHDKWEVINRDMFYSEDRGCWLLPEGNEQFEIRFMSPIPILKNAQELGLSYRFHGLSKLAFVLIKEWKNQEENGKKKEKNG